MTGVDEMAAAAARQPGGTLMLRSDKLTPAELADEVLARAGVRQVHRDGKRMRQARSLDSVASQSGAAAAWDTEYAAGRYSGEPPVAFTGDILAAALQAGLTRGLYIGCGNGRNYLPLVAGGLGLSGKRSGARPLRRGPEDLRAMDQHRPCFAQDARGASSARDACSDEIRWTAVKERHSQTYCTGPGQWGSPELLGPRSRESAPSSRAYAPPMRDLVYISE